MKYLQAYNLFETVWTNNTVTGGREEMANIIKSTVEGKGYSCKFREPKKEYGMPYSDQRNRLRIDLNGAFGSTDPITTENIIFILGYLEEYNIYPVDIYTMSVNPFNALSSSNIRNHIRLLKQSHQFVNDVFKCSYSYSIDKSKEVSSNFIQTLTLLDSNKVDISNMIFEITFKKFD